MRSPRVLLAALVLAACSPAPPAEPKPLPPVVVKVPPRAATQPAASAAPEEQPAPQPLPKLDTPALDEQLAFLSALCRVAVHRDKDGTQHVGCIHCAPFQSPDTKPNGTVAVDPDTFYALRVLLHGSFTRPSAIQIAATLDGCEPHSANYGGTLVAEQQRGAWTVVRYDSGVHPDSCITYRRPDGHDILVCRWGDGHQSYWHDRIFTYDFTLATEDDIAKGFDEVLSMDDDSVAGCILGSLPGQAIRSGQIESFTLNDANRDGALDLVVIVSQIKGKANKAYSERCAAMIAAMESDGPPVNVTEVLGKRRTYTLVFAHDGRTFAPTKATQAILKSL